MLSPRHLLARPLLGLLVLALLLLPPLPAASAEDHPCCPEPCPQEMPCCVLPAQAPSCSACPAPGLSRRLGLPALHDLRLPPLPRLALAAPGPREAHIWRPPIHRLG